MQKIDNINQFRKYIIECPICGSQDHSDGRCESGDDIMKDKYNEGR